MSRTLSELEIAQLVEYGEAEAYADMFQAASPTMGLRVERDRGMVALIAPNAPVLLFNRVIGLGLEGPESDDLLDRIAGLYADSALYGIQLTPMSQLRPERLERFGLRASNRWAKMYREAEADLDVPTDLEVVQIGWERAEEFARVTIAAHGMPPTMAPWTAALVGRADWRAFAALEANAIVAVGMTFVRNDVAWLGLGGTLPSHRRRGAQGAIMAQRIRDAAAQGCRWVITETGEDLPERPNPSFHNMIRTGFELAYQRPNHIFRRSQNH